MEKQFNFTRIIHPIGQGAFYSEQIEYNDSNYNVVFDCGSCRNPNTTKSLKSEISSRFNIGDEIEILFISHFDNDHVNGVQTLIKHGIKIKNIVIPLVEEKDFWFFSQEYGMEYNRFKYIYNYLCNNADKVYKVKPQNIEKNDIRDNIHLSENEKEKPEEIVNLSESKEINKGKIIDSNTLFFINRKIDWCYVVFNYDMDTRRKKFLENLKEEGLTEDVFFHGFEKISSHIKQIKKAYKKLIKNDGLNLSSIIVYSGGYQNRYSCIIDYNCSRFCYRLYCELCRHNLYHTEGCIYLGDTDLNQEGLIDDLKCKLKNLSTHIGLIQIPHHGSKKNFNKDIFKINDDIRYCFVSYGSKNDYGHPSISVLSQIKLHGKIVFEVTENRCSYLSQRLYAIRHWKLI